MLRIPRIVVSVAGIGVILSAGTGHAQTVNTTSNDAALEEIVVTAERRTENLQNTAASVSVRSGDELQREGRFSLQQILEDIPGVAGGAAIGISGVGTDTPANGVRIRGVTSNEAGRGGINAMVPATAIYVDGVVGGIGGNYDIDRVEVLRGPQGTLYGRSATAGVVATHTRDPQLATWEGNAAIEVGNYDLRHYTAALNLPVGEQLAFRVSGNRYTRDGYYLPVGNSQWVEEGRVKMLYEPTENLRALVGFALQDNHTHSGEGAGQLEGPNTVVYVLGRPVGSGKNIFRQYWAQIDWDLGGATLTYLPALRRWEQDALVISTQLGGFRQEAKTPYDQFHTQELRLASNGESALKWQTGVFYYDNDLRSYNEVWTGVDASGNRTGGYVEDVKSKSTTNIGLFAESTYSFTQALRLTAGVRYDRTKLQIEEDYTDRTFVPVFRSLGGDEGKQTFKNWTYKLRLEGDLTDANMLYASVSTGVLPGDIQVISPSAGVLEVTNLSAETLTSFEIGSKNRFLDERLQINGDVFYYRYGAFQRPGTVVRANPPDVAFANLTSGARMWGAELEAQYRPTRADHVSMSVGYVHARYVDKDPLFASIVLQDSVNNMSPLTGQLSYGHDFELPGEQQLSINIDANFVGAYTLNDERPVARGVNLGGQDYTDYLESDNEVVANLSATWTILPKISLTGYVRNVADNRYKNSAAIVQDPATAADPPGGGLSDPRTYGAIVNVGF